MQWCLFCSWYWLFVEVDFGKEALTGGAENAGNENDGQSTQGIVKAASLPVVEAASAEVTKGIDTEDVGKKEGSEQKKKNRVSNPDRKVVLTEVFFWVLNVSVTLENILCVQKKISTHVFCYISVENA